MTLAALVKESREDREAWHYTSLEAYAGLAFQDGVAAGVVQPLPAARTLHRLVFVDGAFKRSLSLLDNLPDGFLSPCDVGENCCTLALSGQTCLAIDPIELLFVTTAQDVPTERETTIKVALGENSRLTLIERHVCCASDAQVRHITFHIQLATQSKLVHGKIISGAASDLHFSKTKVSVAAGAFYDHFALIAGGRLVRCEQEVALQGKLAETRLLGVMLLAGVQHGDITSLVRHETPHTSSHQVCKAVLADKAHGVFQGKIHVTPGAQKTDGYQLCRALLLSDKAEMDAKPELEIYADDVKCSHGTAIGDLDENAMFYLLSRGIPANEARAMLVDAFVGEVLDMCASQEMAGVAREEVDKWLTSI